VGLGAKYVVLNTGVQEAGLLKELEKAGVVGEGQGRREVFDTIVCSKVLCSVPDQEAAVKTLYSLLKPGGTLLACEHVSNRWREPKGSLVARIQQVVFTYLGWTFFMGGCHLNRDTEAVLKKAAEADGGWKELDFERVTEWGSIPFVFGRFVKR
jgi:2-polyprenyl-3-methyl-5-hydroxy-6-metoxy-1,4-benzoquinol methylase